MQFWELDNFSGGMSKVFKMWISHFFPINASAHKLHTFRISASRAWEMAYFSYNCTKKLTHMYHKDQIELEVSCVFSLHFDSRTQFSAADSYLVSWIYILPDTYEVIYNNLCQLTLLFQFIKDVGLWFL